VDTKPGDIVQPTGIRASDHGAAGENFARLLEVEAALELELAQTRAEAARLRQESEDDLRRQSESLEREVAGQDRALASEVEERLQKISADIRRKAQAEVAAYAAIPPTRVDEIAHDVVARLVAGLGA